MNTRLLEVEQLAVSFSSEQGEVAAVKGISFHLEKGETLGIVGESGSGKSVTALSLLRLLPGNVSRLSGTVRYHTRSAEQKAWQAQASENLLLLPDTSMLHVRGAEIAMIFQEPMSSLNPVFRCGDQVAEAIRLHQQVNRQQAEAQVLEWFERVKLPNPQRIYRAYPHQISGGQKQRVMIAMAMSCRPSILIADEPTTALDVTVQKAILDLMRELREANDLSMLFISHDLGVMAEIADRVAVMYRGEIVEEGPVEQVLQQPGHPYTKGLIACRPSLERKVYRLPTIADFIQDPGFQAKVVPQQQTEVRRGALMAQNPVLQVQDLVVQYPARKNWWGGVQEWLNAVDQVSFSVYPGETYGLAGESGCGKTTLGRAIARLVPARQGAVQYAGKEILHLPEHMFRPFRKDIQLIFQDPYASLNPRMNIGRAIMEPMQVHHLYGTDPARREKTVELLETVGLQADHFQRYPHEFSGGQRQRICIARALALEPRFVICDEIVSALDVSVQATILNLLSELQEKFGLSYLFISHDLSVIRQMCDRMLVMHRGKVEAEGFPDEIFKHSENKYVRQLIEAIPGKRKG